MRRIGLLPAIYLIVGAFVAADHSYFAHLGTIGRVVSAVLAIVVWPLVLAGTRIHVAIG